MWLCMKSNVILHEITCDSVWADEVMKCNYKNFGDIISFDETFSTVEATWSRSPNVLTMTNKPSKHIKHQTVAQIRQTPHLVLARLPRVDASGARQATVWFGEFEVGFPLTRQTWIFQFWYEYVICLIENTRKEFWDLRDPFSKNTHLREITNSYF